MQPWLQDSEQEQCAWSPCIKRYQKSGVITKFKVNKQPWAANESIKFILLLKTSKKYEKNAERHLDSTNIDIDNYLIFIIVGKLLSNENLQLLFNYVVLHVVINFPYRSVFFNGITQLSGVHKTTKKSLHLWCGVMNFNFFGKKISILICLQLTSIGTGWKRPAFGWH